MSARNCSSSIEPAARLKPYGHPGGGSGVVAFEIEARAITIRFQNDERYRYTYERTGQFEVEKMKRLAESGRGLSTYISRFIGDRYAEKL